MCDSRASDEFCLTILQQFWTRVTRECKNALLLLKVVDMKRKMVFTYLAVDIQSTAGNAFCLLLLLFAERWLNIVFSQIKMSSW